MHDVAGKINRTFASLSQKGLAGQAIRNTLPARNSFVLKLNMLLCPDLDANNINTAAASSYAMLKSGSFMYRERTRCSNGEGEQDRKKPAFFSRTKCRGIQSRSLCWGSGGGTSFLLPPLSISAGRMTMRTGPCICARTSVLSENHGPGLTCVFGSSLQLGRMNPGLLGSLYSLRSCIFYLVALRAGKLACCKPTDPLGCWLVGWDLRCRFCNDPVLGSAGHLIGANLN